MSARGGSAVSGIDALLRKARLAGALEAEVFFKSALGRTTILEPGLLSGARPRVTVSTSEEEGVALRLRDRKGRWGFAWSSPAGGSGTRGMVEMALASAGAGAGPGPAPQGRESDIPCAPPGDPPPEQNLKIDDPEILSVPVEKVLGILAEASDAAASSAGRAAAVDKALLSEARTAVTLQNSLGFRGSYSKTLGLLSVSLVPVEGGAVPVLEERSACGLRGLDPRECGLEGARRSLPPRPPVPPPAESPPVILSARASSSFLSALIPWCLPGDGASGRKTAATSKPHGLWVVEDPLLPGAVGTAPFDGVGRRSARRILVAGGQPAGLRPLEGTVVRPSFREPPAFGLTNVYIAAPPAGEETRIPEDPWSERGPCLHVESARFVPGPAWTVRILRGEWRSRGGRSGTPLGSADGIVWEGPLDLLLRGVVATGSDLRFYHLGMLLGAPTLAIQGLGRFVVESGRGAVTPRPGPFERQGRARGDRGPGK